MHHLRTASVAFALALVITACTRPAPAVPATTPGATTPASNATAGGGQIATPLRSFSTGWRFFGARKTSDDPDAASLSFDVGVRLGSFPRLVLTVLEGELWIERVVIVRDVQGRRAGSHRVERTVGGQTPSFELDLPMDRIESVQVYYRRPTSPAEIQIWGLNGQQEDEGEPGPVPSQLVDVMAYAAKTPLTIQLGARNQVFTRFSFGNDGCVDLRGLILRLDGGEEVRVRPASPPKTDEYGNHDSWGFELPGNRRHIDRIVFDYRMDPSLCDHASIRLFAL